MSQNSQKNIYGYEQPLDENGNVLQDYFICPCCSKVRNLDEAVDTEKFVDNGMGIICKNCLTNDKNDLGDRNG